MLLLFVLLESVLVGAVVIALRESRRGDEPSAKHGRKFFEHGGSASAVVYPIEMWRTRRDVTVLRHRPFDWTRDDAGDDIA